MKDISACVKKCTFLPHLKNRKGIAATTIWTMNIFALFSFGKGGLVVAAAKNLLYRKGWGF
jgi:hypothetical protein